MSSGNEHVKNSALIALKKQSSKNRGGDEQQQRSPCTIAVTSSQVAMIGTRRFGLVTDVLLCLLASDNNNNMK